MSCDVMVFSAHPDDAEFLMGGTLIRLARAGKKIIHVSLTPSQMSTHGNVDSRRGEFEAAAKLFNAVPIMLDFMDTEVENNPVSRTRVARLIREHRPAVVFAPYHTNALAENGGSAHHDHYTTGALVRDAVKLARLEKTVPDVAKHTVLRTYFYMLPRNVVPNVVIDITEYIDDVEKLIACYNSQMAINVRGIGVHDSLMTQKRHAGLIIGAKYAEHFVTDTPLKLTPDDFLRL